MDVAVAQHKNRLPLAKGGTKLGSSADDPPDLFTSIPPERGKSRRGIVTFTPARVEPRSQDSLRCQARKECKFPGEPVGGAILEDPYRGSSGAPRRSRSTGALSGQPPCPCGPPRTGIGPKHTPRGRSKAPLHRLGAGRRPARSRGRGGGAAQHPPLREGAPANL